MKVLIQRVLKARVLVDGQSVGDIGRGVLVFLGIERGDTPALSVWYARRMAGMKLFPGENTLWEKTLGEVKGEVLLVSQFTLAARTRKGRRPSFDPAAPPEIAVPLYEKFRDTLQEEGLHVAEGRFGAMMQVELTNDGPVTFLLDGPAGEDRE